MGTLGPHVGDDSHPAISYWDWTSVSAKGKKNEFIQRLLEEEKIREQMTIEHIQGNLLKSCAERETSPPVVSVTSNIAVESYWIGRTISQITMTLILTQLANYLLIRLLVNAQ